MVLDYFLLLTCNFLLGRAIPKTNKVLLTLIGVVINYGFILLLPHTLGIFITSMIIALVGQFAGGLLKF